MPRRLPLSLTCLETDQIVLATRLPAAMQRVTDAIVGGYTHAVQGAVPLKKAAGLLEKFRARYPALARDRKFAYRLRKAGKARHKLVCFANRSGAQLLFVLMTDLPDSSEDWVRVTDRRGRVAFYEYEAVRATKSDAGQVWTWQISSTAFADGVAMMKTAIRGSELEQLQHMIERSRTWPGFHGVRAQRDKLIKEIAGEWIRTMPKGTPPPSWPRLRYVQRLRTR